MTNNLVLIGAGKFGKNYITTLNTFTDVSLTVANRDNWKQLVDAKPDGVLICTPPQSHIEIASYALEQNIPVMVEKPLALSLQDCQVLKQYNAPILVNHIHLFSNTYQNIKKIILKNNIKIIKSLGSGPSAPRDYSRLWDYGPHDISMILDLTQKFPHTVECSKDDKDNFIIKLHFDTLSSVSKVGFSETRQRLLEIDGVFLYDGMIKELPLTNALRVFVDAINGKADYRLGLDLSLKVMQVLESCQKFLDLPH